MWKILIVDDYFSNRRILSGILKSRAICEFAGNGLEALRLCEEAVLGKKPFDLILLDFKMPELDGLQFLKELRDREAGSGVGLGKGTRVIMVTAYPEVFMKNFQQGGDDYLLKPVNAQDLLQRVEALLGPVSPTTPASPG